MNATTDPLTALIDRLAVRHGFAALDADRFETFIADAGDTVVLFPENPTLFPETFDIAVVFPDILAGLGGRLKAGVLDLASARRLQAAYGFRVWPALVFFRGGRYVGVIEGMQEWNDFRRETAAMLERPAGRAPTIGIAVTAAGGASCH